MRSRRARQWRRATVATPVERQCKTGGVRRLAVANGPNIFQMLLVVIFFNYFLHVLPHILDFCNAPMFLFFCNRRTINSAVISYNYDTMDTDWSAGDVDIGAVS